MGGFVDSKEKQRRGKKPRKDLSNGRFRILSLKQINLS